MNLHTVLIKPASGMCNMHCDYCFYSDETAKRNVESYGLMAEDTLKNVIKKTLFQASKDVCFAFQGGEPTLRGIDFFRKALEFEKTFNKNNVHIRNALQTNGLYLNEEWCRMFKDHNFLIGISVDGTEITHNMYRHTKAGADTYGQVKESVRLLEKNEIDFNILTVVNKETAGAIKEIYKEYKRNGWSYQQYITCLDPLDEEQGNQKYSLTPVEYGDFLTDLFDMWYRDWKRGKAPYIRQFENYIGILLGYPPESCEQNGTCSIQGVVEADGSLYPCDFYALDEYCLGNFNKNRIRDFFQNETARSFIEESKKISNICKECSYFRLCRGACRRSRVKETGQDTYRSYFCEGYKRFFEKCGQRLVEIAEYLR